MLLLLRSFLMGMQSCLPRARRGPSRLHALSVCGHAWEEWMLCTWFLLSIWPLQKVLKLACANSMVLKVSSKQLILWWFCELLLWDSFLRHSCVRADPHLCKGLCEQQAITFLMEVQTKKCSAFMLLCNISFIPQRHFLAGKNKTLQANAYSCQHP